MLLNIISFSCYPTICLKIKFIYVYVFYMFLLNIIGKILFLLCFIEFYKEGKYDLDFKNPNSDPSKWVENFIKICFA